jgi:hypothetical protein
VEDHRARGELCRHELGKSGWQLSILHRDEYHGGPLNRRRQCACTYGYWPVDEVPAPMHADQVDSTFPESTG